MTDEDFRRGTWKIGDKVVPQEVAQAEIAKLKRGRPPASVTKSPVKLRIDPDVLAAMRESGRGWQTRVNDLLREAVQAGKFRAHS